RWLTGVLEVLRLMAERGEREDARARPDRRPSSDDDVAQQLAVLSEADVTTYHTMRPDPRAGRNARAGLDHCERAYLDAGSDFGIARDNSRRVDLRVRHSSPPRRRALPPNLRSSR